MPYRIEPGWRYALAQWFLWLLFGRRWHFISPWPMAGIGAGVVIVWQGKVLLHQRRGPIENVGKWGSNGGYLNLHHQETLAIGLAREIFEETGLRVRAESFVAPFYTVVVYGQDKLEMANHTSLAYWYAVTAPTDLLPLIKDSNEAHHFRWVTEPDMEALGQQGLLASAETYEALQRAFALMKSGQGLPMLQLLPAA